MYAMTVFCIHFGRMPHWITHTLHSFYINNDVKFVMIGDHFPKQVSKNVKIIKTTWSAFSYYTSIRFNTSVHWHIQECTGNNCGRVIKISDLRPFLGKLFELELQDSKWWGWMDLDVILGKIRYFLYKERADVLCPMWPNKYNLLTWGAFTAFKVNSHLISSDNKLITSGLTPYLLSREWKKVLVEKKHFAFEELAFFCGGPFCQLGMCYTTNIAKRTIFHCVRD